MRYSILIPAIIGASLGAAQAQDFTDVEMTVSWTQLVKPRQETWISTPSNIILSVWRNRLGGLSGLSHTDQGLSFVPEIGSAREPQPIPLGIDLARATGAPASDGGFWLGTTLTKVLNKWPKQVGVPRAYVARFDVHARKLFELSDERHRLVNNVVPIVPDDAIVVGHQNHYGREPDKFWLQRVSAAGRVNWDQLVEHGSSRSFGSDHQSAAAALNDGTIAVVAIEYEKGPKDPEHRKHLRLWLLAPDGKPVRDMRVRDALDRRYVSEAALAMVADEDIFLMSQGRSGYSEVRYGLDTTLAGGPLEVVRIAPRGTVLWRTTLPASVQSERKNNCVPLMTRAENGDLRVSCAFGGRLDLYRLDRRTGTFRHVVATLPDCAGPYASVVFVAEMNSDIVLVGTLPPTSSLRPGELRCSFRGTIRADSLN